MAKDPSTGLTDLQQKFCLEYLKDFNATAAYKRAGYAVKTDSAARTNASRLLTNANVQAYLARVREESSNRSKVSLERTLQEIGRVAFSNVTDALSFDSSGVVLNSSDKLPEDVSAAIASVSSTETENEFGAKTTFSLKMHNKLQALGLLAQYFGITDDFNKARSTLKRYGLALIQDGSSAMGWRLEAYDPSRSDTPA